MKKEQKSNTPGGVQRNASNGRFEAVSKPVEPIVKAGEYVSKLENYKQKQAAKKK